MSGKIIKSSNDLIKTELGNNLITSKSIINKMKVGGILDYSIDLKEGDKVFIFADCKSKQYCDLISKKIIERKAIPFVLWNDFLVNRSLITSKNDSIYHELFNIYEKMIDSCDAAIMLDNNIEAYNGINYDDLINFKQKYYLKIFKKIMNFKRWVYLRYPEQKLADLFGISYEEHIKLLEEVSNFDYQILKESCFVLKELMDRTYKVRIVHGLTDVTFTKKGIPSVICLGKINLPDGEIYTAPEKYSMNGIIHFNIDFFRNHLYKNVKVEVVNGKIINSNCNINDKFTKILDSDPGARYFGEFAFGLNPHIKTNYNDNLFNEKMSKTVHFAIGYPHWDTDNWNESLIHWDLIINLEDGGKIYFDDILIQKNWLFVLDELKSLNPDE